jgi:glycosyltransferase involved in cell wall biosynthesis
MPSKGEGFGFVFLEAMACGVPVIAGNMNGSTEALCFGALGTLVDPNNIKELEVAIYDIIRNKCNPKEIQKKVLEKYSFSLFFSSP